MLIDDTENYFRFNDIIREHCAIVVSYRLIRKLRKKTLYFAHDPCSDLSRFITRAETFFRFAGSDIISSPGVKITRDSRRRV